MGKISLINQQVTLKLRAAAEGCRAELMKPGFYYGSFLSVAATFVAVLIVPVILLGLAIMTGAPGAIVIAKILMIFFVFWLPAWSSAIAWFKKLGEDVADSVQTDILLLPNTFDAVSNKSGDDQFISRDIAPPAEPPRHQARVNLNEILVAHFSLNSGRSYGAV